jgi:putative IMPACT (imprinted ancient) family translation regulator
VNNFVSILKNTISEIEIKKSKFIGLSFFVESEFEAQTLIDKINKQYFDATHVCYAYVLNNIEKCDIAHFWGKGVHKNCGVSYAELIDSEYQLLWENKIFY